MKIRIFAATFTVLACVSAGAQTPPPGGANQSAVPPAPQAGVDPRPPNAKGQTPAFAGQTRAPERKANVAFDVVTVAEGLEKPWGLTFLPGGKMLVTEKPGRLRVVGADGKLSEPVAGLPAVDERGQGGLLDVSVDPAFASNQLIYWSYAEPRENGVNNSAVARGRFVDEAAPRVENVQVIFHQVPSLNSQLHYGGRLVWARDGKLFVTLGERSITEGRMQSQRMDGLLGKIVRINSDGSIPTDNPFVGKEGVRPEIWSLGHRNVEAATLNPTTGELWETEHGARGGDEINIARKGKDYGWPTITYGIEYRRQPNHREHHRENRYGAGALLLGSRHRAKRNGLLHRDGIPGLEGKPLHWRPREQQPGEADGRRGAGRRRGASADRHAAA